MIMLKNQRLLLFLIIGAFLIRLALAGLVFFNFGEQGFFLPDSQGFYQTAQNLLEGRGFSRDISEPFRASAFFPPLYSLLVSASLFLSNSVVPLIFFQIILSALMPILVWKIGLELTEREKVPLIAAGLTAFEPLGMLWSFTVLTDAIAVFFLTLAALFFIRFVQNNSRVYALLAGLVLALAALTRPEPYYLFPVAMLFLLLAALFKKLSWQTVLIFPLIFIAVMSPWLTRNYAEFGSLSGTTTGARNIYTDLAVSVETYRTGRPYHLVEEELKLSLAQRLGVDPKDISENPALGPVLAKEGFRIMLEHPRATAATLAITANSFFTQDLYTTYLRYFKVIPHFPIDFSPSVLLLREGPLELASRVWSTMGLLAVIPVLGRAFWIALTLLWIAGAIFALRNVGRERFVSLVLAAIILIYAGGSLAAGFSDQGRHRYPINAFIFVLASYAILEFWEWRIFRRSRRIR